MNRHPKLLLSFLLSFVYFLASGQYKLTDPLPTDPNVKIGKLSNGLTYYIRKNVKPEKKLELRLVVNAGSILENNDQRGLAHFMEHMGFNGSTHFPKNELVNYLQKSGVKFGADLNAYTSFDETVYILPIPTDDPTVVEKGFTVLEDWAFNNLFDKNEIEKERGVVLEESRLGKGAQERMLRQYFPHLFNGSKYAERLPIGKDETIKGFQPASLIKFYKQWYRPDLMAVIVVGDMDPAEAEKKIKDHFGKFKNPANEQPRPAIIPIKPRAQAEAMVLTDEEATNTILQVYNFVKPATKVKTWGDYEGSIKEELLSSLINQRLTELTQKENPPFAFVFTGYSPFLRGYKTFISFAFLGKAKVQDAVDALIEEVQRARQFGFLQTELDRAKADLMNEAEKAEEEKDKSESGRIVSAYVNNYLEGDPIPGVTNRYNFLKQVIPGVSLTDMNSLAAKMPSADKAFALLEGPKAMKDNLPDSAALLKGLLAAAKKPVKPYEEKAVAKALIDQEPQPGKITSETKNDKLGSTDLTLSNGVTITIKPTTLKNDDIQMDSWRFGGYEAYKLEDKENAMFAPILVNEMGVKDMTPTDLGKFMSGKTVTVQPYINPSEEGVQGNSSVKDFEIFLQLVNLYFTQPRKDEALFNSFISKQKSFVQFSMKDPRTYFADTLNKIEYQNNPWVASLNKEEDYDRINLDRSFDIYKQIFSNAYGLHFTFVGNLDVAKAKPLLEKYIGSLPASPKENAYKDNGIRLIQGVTEVNLKRGKEPKSLINLAFEGPADGSREERLNLAALIEVINIRINEKLREEMSGMYHGNMSGSILKRPYLHYSIGANIPCGPENVDKLYAALVGIIKDAQEKGIDQKDLEKVKETWRKEYHVNLQSNDYWLDQLSNAWINQDNPENILDYEQKIDSLTPESVQAIAKKFLTLNNMVKAVLYPENANVKDEVKTIKAF
jgi:zinc protease